MSRRRLAGWMLAITAAAVLIIAGRGEEPAVQARLVRVSRGNVRQVAALTGRVAWQNQQLVYAYMPGIVAEVLVKEGERVAAGQALVRLESGAAERAAAVWLRASDTYGEDAPATAQEMLEATVIRAPDNATVRQIMTADSAMVAAGEPVVLLSTTQQEIVCTALEVDARRVQSGMDAVLLLDGEELCRAEVTGVGAVAADPVTGRMICSVTLRPEKPLELPAGAAVEADVWLAGRDGVPVLPVEAVTARGTVWWVCDDGRCTEIPAEIVLSDEMHVWVGLPEGLTVAVGEFNDGQRVQEVQP